MMNNAVLSKDNLIKRNWPRSHDCFFCPNDENLQHLFFTCSNARAVWAIVAYSVGASNIPNSLEQCWNWCRTWLPNGRQFHTFGIAAILWAIWKSINSICFENKKNISPSSIVCYACTLTGYWVGLFLETNQENVKAALYVILAIATKMVAQEKKRERLEIGDTPEDEQDE